MAHYERSITLQADARRVYEFVADVRNMPHYLPTVQRAEMKGSDRVEMEGNADGHQYEDEGFLHRDGSFKRLEWGADEHDYSGWMDVDSAGDNRTTVTIGLSFENDQDERMGARDIEQSLQSALEAIRQHVESGG